MNKSLTFLKMMWFYYLFSSLLIFVAIFGRFIGLQADYFNTSGWDELPIKSSIKLNLSFTSENLFGDFTKGSEFSAHFYGYLLIPFQGRYQFRLNAIDDAWIKIDDNLVGQTQAKSGLLSSSEGLFLDRGFHKIDIGYFDQGNDYRLEVLWKHKRQNNFSDIPFFLLYPKNPLTILRLLIYNVFFFMIVSWLGLTFFHCRHLLSKSRGQQSVMLVNIGTISIFVVMTVNLINDMIDRRQKAVHGCDTYGYLQAAINMVEHGFFKTQIYDEAIPLVSNSMEDVDDEGKLIFFQGPHAYYIVNFKEGVLANQYPPGFPLIISIIYRFFSENSVYYINIIVFLILNLVIVWFFYCRQNWLAGLVVSILCLYQPLLFEHSIILMSDILSALLIFYAIILSIDTSESVLKSLFIGIIVGFALLIRYSNIIVIIPILSALLFKNTHRVRQIIVFLMSLLIAGIGPLMWYQYRIFGSPWKITYAFHNTSKVTFTNIPKGFIYYAHIIYNELGIWLMMIVMIGIIAGLIISKTRLLSFCFLFFIVSHWLYISMNAILLPRYIVPLVPILMMFFGFVFASLSERFRSNTKMIFFIHFIIIAVFLTQFQQREMFTRGAGREAEEIPYLIGQNTEENARILCDDLTGSLRIYGNRFGYRVLHIPYQYLVQIMNILLENDYPLYLAIDCSELWPMKKKLESRFTLTLIEGNTGVPLYRIN